MAKVKMTKVEKFEVVLAELTKANAPKEYLEFIQKERDMVERKNAKKATGERKPSKTQIENEEKAKRVTKFFFDEAIAGHAYTTLEIGDIVGIENISSQKATAIMKKAENFEKVKIDGKVAYVSLIVVEDDEIEED